MTLCYTFYDVPVKVLCDPSYHVNQELYEPTYKTKIEDEMDYEFDVEPTENDIIDFIKKETVLGNYLSEEQIKEALNSESLEGLFDLDGLEENYYFEDFMTDRYYEEARNACLEECGGEA